MAISSWVSRPSTSMTCCRRMTKGRGVINLLAADQLLQSPQLYATFLLWLLSELFEHLPEVGDLEKPKLVFFFDEAHLLFKDQPAALLTKIEQVVRLIRSKGVGVYFVTQNPVDVPDTCARAIGQSRSACAAGLHAQGSESGEVSGRDVPAEPEAGRERGDHAARSGRGAGFVSRREGDARHRRAGVRLSAACADRANHAGRTAGSHAAIVSGWSV